MVREERAHLLQSTRGHRPGCWLVSTVTDLEFSAPVGSSRPLLLLSGIRGLWVNHNLHGLIVKSPSTEQAGLWNEGYDDSSVCQRSDLISDPRVGEGVNPAAFLLSTTTFAHLVFSWATWALPVGPPRYISSSNLNHNRYLDKSRSYPKFTTKH